MIGKIEKARRYAREPERISVQDLTTIFHGTHDDYTVSLHDHTWTCSCHAFTSHAVEACPHIMAIQQLLSPMLPSEDRVTHSAVA
jgi:hypothetical protein